jgi:hypothetical protein
MKYLFWPSLLLGAILILSSCQETPCDGVSCVNGDCIEALGICECLPGYEGSDCSVESRQKFLGTYQVQYQGCFSTSPGHTIGIEQSDLDLTKVYIYDLGDYECPGGDMRIKLEAEIDSVQINIPEQTMDCGLITYTFSGSGSKQSSVLNLAFTVTYTSDGIDRIDECTAKLEK